MAITLPEPAKAWKVERFGALPLTVRHLAAPAFIVGWDVELSPQPDLTRIDLAAVFPGEGGEAAGEEVRFQGARLEVDPRHGPAIVAEGTLVGAPAAVQGTYYATSVGALRMLVAAEPKHLSAAAELARSLFVVTSPPVPEDQLEYGEVTLKEGYRITLPAHYRRLTDGEAAREGILPKPGSVSRVFLDPAAKPGHHAFGCVTNVESEGPLPVMEEEKDPARAASYRSRARAVASGGKTRSVRGKDVYERDYGSPARGLTLTKDEGVLQVRPLGDRDGWFWRVPATLDGVEGEAMLLYTAFDTTAVDCAAFLPQGMPELAAAMEASLLSLRVVEGEAHPMRYTTMERYKRWWPTTHPALQLYWVPIPLALLALWVATRE